MRYRIAICDDEKNQRELLAGMLKRWLSLRGYTAEINCYESAESFLFDYEEDKATDILLLDIQMEGMDGVALARRLRDGGERGGENRRVQIVFITGYSDYMAEGYEVEALHYLMKPVKEEKLFEILDRASRNLSRVERSLLLSCDGEAVRIPVGEIQYAEIFSHTAVIVTTKGSYETRMPIKELEARLGEGFVRCHRSFIAGLKYIRSITKTDVVLDSGKTLPLSRRCYDEVNKTFIRFYGNPILNPADGKEGD